MSFAGIRVHANGGGWATPAGRSGPALGIGRSDDPAEHEADHLAEELIADHPNPPAERSPWHSAASFRPQPMVLQRKSVASAPIAGAAPPIVAATLARGGGVSLPAGERAFFKPRLGSLIDGVRIHTDERAGASATAIGARAYTVGNDVVFAPGQWRPGTADGRRLLAHELAHVGQRTDKVLRKLDVKEKKNVPLPGFEFKGGKQMLSSPVNGGSVDVLYIPIMQMMTCTMKAMFIFPPGWDKGRRDPFIQGVREQLDFWGEHGPRIEELVNGAPTGIRVKVNFMLQVLDPIKDVSLMNSAFKFKVNDQLVRDNVLLGTEVELDPLSNQKEKNTTAGYRNYGKKRNGIGRKEYEHYQDAGIKLGLPAKDATFEQSATAHELGHLFGLADEYIMDREDYATALGPRNDVAKAEAQMKERSKADGSIMNMGSAIRPDHFRPFAHLLTVVDGGTWRPEGDS